MAFSLKQFLLLLILFAGFALSALLNSERTYMLEIVKLVTFFTLVLMAYAAWASEDKRRAYCLGFVLWGGLYYTLFVVLRGKPIDLGTDHFLLWLGQFLDRRTPGGIIWAVYEKTGHLLLSIFFGILGGWITLFFYSIRSGLRTTRKASQND